MMHAIFYCTVQLAHGIWLVLVVSTDRCTSCLYLDVLAAALIDLGFCQYKPASLWHHYSLTYASLQELKHRNDSMMGRSLELSKSTSKTEYVVSSQREIYMFRMRQRDCAAYTLGIH
jgi:hypothetical protein